jgi:hypothetical protein
MVYARIQTGTEKRFAIPSPKLLGPLAVHGRIDREEGRLVELRDRYVVTHVPTGRRVLPDFDRRGSAIAYALALLESGIPWHLTSKKAINTAANRRLYLAVRAKAELGDFGV